MATPLRLRQQDTQALNERLNRLLPTHAQPPAQPTAPPRTQYSPLSLSEQQRIRTLTSDSVKIDGVEEGSVTFVTALPPTVHSYEVSSTAYSPPIPQRSHFRTPETNQQSAPFSKDTTAMYIPRSNFQPSNFRSRQSSISRIPQNPILNSVSSPPTSPPNSPPTTEKKLYVGQPIHHVVTSPAPSTLNLDTIQSTWPKNGTLQYQRRKSDDDLEKCEDETLKHSSEDEVHLTIGETGNPTEKNKRSRSKSRSRSRSRDTLRETTDDDVDSTGLKKRKRKRKLQGTVITKKNWKFLKATSIFVIVNLVILDCVVIALVIAFFL